MRDKDFNITKNPKYDGDQRSLDEMDSVSPYSR